MPLRNHPPHRHPPVFPGLNSPFTEALCEYSHPGTIEELMALIERHQPRLVPILNNIRGEQINDLPVAITLLQIDEGIATLRAWRDLILLSTTRKAAVILPLPPHISERLIPALHRDLIFVADHHLPPHLSRQGLEHLDDLMPHDLRRRLSGLEAVAFEGFYEAGNLRVHRSIGRFLQLMNGNICRLFIHWLPHVPHHGEWVTLTVSHEIINL